MKPDSQTSESKSSQEIKTGGAGYVVWRGALLAELALARAPELSVHKPKQDCGYDFLVATPSGTCFFVLVKAFSSKKLSIRDVQEIVDLRWRIDTKHIRRARASHTPVLVFLIDADTDHGRYLRLDTTPIRRESSQSQMIRFALKNTIDKEGVETLIAELQRSNNAVRH